MALVALILRAVLALTLVALPIMVIVYGPWGLQLAFLTVGFLVGVRWTRGDVNRRRISFVRIDGLPLMVLHVFGPASPGWPRRMLRFRDAATRWFLNWESFVGFFAVLVLAAIVHYRADGIEALVAGQIIGYSSSVYWYASHGNDRWRCYPASPGS